MNTDFLAGLLFNRRWALTLCAAIWFGGAQARADIVESITINTSSLSGISGNLAFDFLDGGPPSNAVTISGFTSDGALGAATLTGGATGLLPGTIRLTDSSFFNEYLTAFTFGNSIRFQIDQTANPPDPGYAPDEFSFYLLDSTAASSLVTTSDPSGANSLFEVGSDGSVDVFSSPQVTTTMTAPVPEPSAFILLATAILAAGLPRLLRRRRMRVWLGIALLACWVIPRGIEAQNFHFTKIVDQSTPRPDGGTFYNPHHPSTDGTYVVWNEEWGNFSIWSANLSNPSTLIQVADTNTTAPGGTGNFSGFGGGACPSDVEVRGGNVVFNGTDQAGQGLYSASAAGGPLQRIVNYNVTLPNGGTAGAAGHNFCNFGLTDGGTVAFAAFTAGNAADGTALGQSVYTASVDGTNLAMVADGDHMFYDPSQPRVWYANCVEPYAVTAAAYGNTVVFGAGSGGSLNSIYAQTIGTPAQGTSDVPPNYSCALTGGAGPVVTNSLTALPGDPTAGRQLPQYAYFQTDGTSVYFLGYDWNYPCCAGPNGWSGLFSVPLAGGAVTKIAAVGDTLPVIGAVLSFGNEFSADAGGLVFTARGAGGSGIFLYSGGGIAKVLATGDALNNATVGTSDTFEVYPQSYKAGKIAFMWGAGVYVAAPNCAQDVSGSVTVTPHGFLYNRSTGQFVQQVTVTNHSASSIDGPMELFVESLTSDATLANASGVSSCFAPGSPYITLPAAGGSLGPGASVTVTLDFTDPSRGAISYRTAVGAGSATP